MWRASMFKQKDALPRSELHFVIYNRNCLTSARQCHPDMRRHVVAALRTMREVIGIFGHETIEKFFQVAARSRVGILHYDNAATGVLNEDSQYPVPNSASVDLRPDVVSEFIEALSIRTNFELVMIHLHR